MSKRRHKSRTNQEGEINNNINKNTNVNNAGNTNNRQQFNNNPFGINPNQLLSMFGNIDMNQINSMLQSMTTDGFDFNNFNLGALQNLMGGGGRVAGNQNNNQMQQQPKQNREAEEVKIKEQQSNIQGDDENIQMLLYLRKIVNEERGAFIDKILKLYNEGVFEE